MNKGKFFWCSAAAVMVLAAFFLLACELGSSTLEVIVHAASPVITAQPEVKQYRDGDEISFSIEAYSPDDGTLSYQWYSFESGREYYTQEGTLIPGATDTIFKPEDFDLVLEPDTIYKYYVIVTNSKSGVTGLKKVSVQSNEGSAVIADPNNAAYPLITRQPVGATYILRRGISIGLSMAASLNTSTTRGDMTYQWYQAEEYTNERGTPIEGATANAFVPSIGEGGNIDGAGSYYFFVIVTNTDMMAPGKKQTMVVTDVAEIAIQINPDAEVPELTGNPASKIYFVGETETVAPLSVVAYKVGDGGAMTCQWYRNAANANTGGTAIGSAMTMTDLEVEEGKEPMVSATYLPPVNFGAAGRTYYYAVITNNNQNASRTKVTRVTTSAAVIAVQTIRSLGYLREYYSTVTVNLNEPKQYVRGFGGMDVAWGNFPTYSMEDYDMMYNPDKLGYNMVRVMIMPQYTDINRTMEELVGNKIAGSQDRSNFYEFAKLVNRYNGYVLASPWSPPAAWKTNNSVNGGGKLRVSNYRDMANYLDAFARNMYNNGAPIYAVTLQNEPTYTAGYDGCEYESEENRDFFIMNKRFMKTPGYGGGKVLPSVLQVGGESHNEIGWQNDILRNWDSRDYVDFVCRHIYGFSASSGYQLAINPARANVGWQPLGTTRTPTDADAKEIWMTEHNLNSNNATAYPNDSTWNYVWKFMNDVDFVIRINEESAFVWWSSKRFYSMLGDGQYATIDGVVYPRGYGLSHYAKFAKETGRVGVTVDGFTKNMTSLTFNTPTAMVNNSNFTSSPTSGGIDTTSVKITAFVKTKVDRSDMVEIGSDGRTRAASNGWRLNRNNLHASDLSEINLVMYTPTNTRGREGLDMGMVEIQLPEGFLIANAEAIRSVSGRYMFDDSAEVVVDPGRNKAYVSLPPSNIVSVRFTNAN
jgi:O-glycosyl hydrolase